MARSFMTLFINIFCRALAQHERQAMDAAEDARREQVLLACARRDSTRAVAEMQRRHLEAAVQLEGPGPGGAIHAQYEAVREENVLRLTTQTHKEQDQLKENESNGIASPRTNSTEPTPLLRETCRAVASEVETKLERWKEQLQNGSLSFGGPSPVAEPSLANISGSPTANNNYNAQLFGNRNSDSPGRPSSASSWPGIFSFPKDN